MSKHTKHPAQKILFGFHGNPFSTSFDLILFSFNNVSKIKVISIVAKTTILPIKNNLPLKFPA